jgi:hypothetical protein
LGRAAERARGVMGGSGAVRVLSDTGGWGLALLVWGFALAVGVRIRRMPGFAMGAARLWWLYRLLGSSVRRCRCCFVM